MGETIYIPRDKHFDFMHPRGLICLIAPCRKCGVICRDTKEETLFSRKKYGAGKAKRTNGYWSGRGLCEICERVRICNACGKIGTTRNIAYRSDLIDYTRENKRDWAGADSPKHLCVSCWNRARQISKTVEQLDELRTYIRSCERQIDKLRKEKNGKAWAFRKKTHNNT